MRTVKLTDTLVHEYTEYEWADKFPLSNPLTELSLTEYAIQAVQETEEAGLRYFNALVKPVDDLLSEAKPRAVKTIDTWKWRAQEKAEQYAIDHGGEVGLHDMALLALLSRLTEATKVRDIEGDEWQGFGLLLIPVPGYGSLQVTVPVGQLDTLFASVPESKNVFATVHPWETVHILEAVFLHDRKYG